MFPIYSRSQTDIDKLKSVLMESIATSNFIIFPIMAGLAAVSEPLVKIVLTDKWLPCVPYLRLFCIVYGLYHLQNINFMVISALGRSDIYLRYEIIKKLINVFLLLVTVPFGVIALTIGQVIMALISIIINIKPNRKWLNYKTSEQFYDIIPSLLLSFFMAALVWLVQLLNFNTVFTLVIQVTLGMIIYVACAYLLKFKSLNLLWETLRTLGK